MELYVFRLFFLFGALIAYSYDVGWTISEGQAMTTQAQFRKENQAAKRDGVVILTETYKRALTLTASYARQVTATTR